MTVPGAVLAALFSGVFVGPLQGSRGACLSARRCFPPVLFALTRRR